MLDDAQHTERCFEVEPLGDTSFRLWPALYQPWQGMAHGTWKGRHFVDGDHIADVRNEFNAVEVPIWQLCDRPLRIREGDAVGYAILESTLIGDLPDLTTPSPSDVTDARTPRLW